MLCVCGPSRRYFMPVKKKQNCHDFDSIYHMHLFYYYSSKVRKKTNLFIVLFGRKLRPVIRLPPVIELLGPMVFIPLSGTELPDSAPMPTKCAHAISLGRMFYSYAKKSLVEMNKF